MKAAVKAAVAGPSKPSREKDKKEGKGKKKSEIVREQPPLLQKGEVLQNLFEIEEQFGGGGFGQIFRCNHKDDNIKMVVKVEPARGGDLRRAKLEMTVMLMLRGKSHIPILYGCGRHRDCPYIVMQMLGRNLSDLRRRQTERTLSESTVFRVSQHVVTALRHLHDTGYVHRDVKPSNCCVGIGTAKRKIHLIDFGMVRRIRDMDGNIRPARKYAPFRGTVRYVSIEMHYRREVGFGDDLIGWFYSMIELLHGKLPWSSMEKPNEIMKSKMTTTLKELCERHPKGLLNFAENVSKIKYEDKPKYESLQRNLKSCLSVTVNENTPFDWELPPLPSTVRSKRGDKLNSKYEKSMMVSVGTEMPASIPVRPMKKTFDEKAPGTSSKKETSSECRVQLPDKMEVMVKKNSEVPTKKVEADNHPKKVEEKKLKENVEVVESKKPETIVPKKAEVLPTLALIPEKSDDAKIQPKSMEPSSTSPPNKTSPPKLKTDDAELANQLGVDCTQMSSEPAVRTTQK